MLKPLLGKGFSLVNRIGFEPMTLSLEETYPEYSFLLKVNASAAFRKFNCLSFVVFGIYFFELVTILVTPVFNTLALQR
jgi:hypothetical protein